MMEQTPSYSQEEVKYPNDANQHMSEFTDQSKMSNHRKKTHRVHLTAGRKHVHYPWNKSIPTSELTTIK